MSENKFDDLCDSLDAAVFNGDSLFNEENRSGFEKYLRRWDIELKSHKDTSESKRPCCGENQTRHNALVEAVAWERECECFDRWATHTCQPVTYEWDQVIFAARAEVDRLIANDADDCKGEG